MSHDVKYSGMDVHKEAIVTCLCLARHRYRIISIA